MSRTVEVNRIGAMLSARAALPATESRGHVLLVSSAAAGECAEALVGNPERRGRRVFVSPAVGVVAAWRAAGHRRAGKKLVLRRSRTAVTRLEREIADLHGQECGANSVEFHRAP